MCKADNVLKKIEILRKRMMIIAFDKGFASDESVKVSQELDRLLNLYDMTKANK
jgi:stage 0 sporulation regulatory protein